MKLVVLLALAACGDNLPRPADPSCDSWRQWGGNPAHTGQSCVVGQPLERMLADIEADPLVLDERGGPDGDLRVHYQTPLIAGDTVFMLGKSGTFTPCVPNPDETMQCSAPEDLYRFNSQIWSEVAYAWQGNTLVKQWSFESDWKPPPGQETMFQPALVDALVAIPTAHGALALVDASTGALVRAVTPFGDDANTYVVGSLAVDRGFIYYNAVQFDHDDPYNVPMHGSLVAVAASDGRTRIADYATLVDGAPAADELCAGYYDMMTTELPWPPAPAPDGTPILPKPYACGGQVPGFNSAPAVAYDGTLYVASHAQYNEAYSYITSLNPGSLTANWATSLRDQLHDGCGVEIPYVADVHRNYSACRDGSRTGIDPHTGLLPAGLVDNESSSSPVALPHGGVLYGSLSFYNDFRGHLFQLDDEGAFVGTYDFGWDLTPAVASDDAGDRVYMKDNHYTFTADGTDAGPYYLTELDARLHPVWSFKSTETNSCVRQPDGSMSCVDDHPYGFEWCINAPAIDRDGTMYGNSEDGHLYAIAADGSLSGKFFLDTALGSSYTPLALDHAGRVYAINAGHMIVVGAN